jgi:hypothetical protein
MIGDGLGVLEGPAVFEIGRDAGGAKRVATGGVGGSRSSLARRFIIRSTSLVSIRLLVSRPLLRMLRNSQPFLSPPPAAVSIQASDYDDKEPRGVSRPSDLAIGFSVSLSPLRIAPSCRRRCPPPRSTRPNTPQNYDGRALRTLPASRVAATRSACHAQSNPTRKVNPRSRGKAVNHNADQRAIPKSRSGPR